MKNKIDFSENISIEENKNQDLNDRQLSTEMIEQVSGGHIVIIINICPQALAM